MSELKPLENWAAALLAQLQPAQRRRLLADMARNLRSANAQRMRAQTDDEGQPWQQRKPPGPALRSQRERLRQQAQLKKPMFSKLRLAKHLKARAEGDDSAVVEFASRAQRIARVHHWGETDAVNPGGPRVQYPARPLLGISEDDAKSLRTALLDSLLR